MPWGRRPPLNVDRTRPVIDESHTWVFRAAQVLTINLIRLRPRSGGSWISRSGSRGPAGDEAECCAQSPVIVASAALMPTRLLVSPRLSSVVAASSLDPSSVSGAFRTLHSPGLHRWNAPAERARSATKRILASFCVFSVELPSPRWSDRCRVSRSPFAGQRCPTVQPCALRADPARAQRRFLHALGLGPTKRADVGHQIASRTLRPEVSFLSVGDNGEVLAVSAGALFVDDALSGGPPLCPGSQVRAMGMCVTLGPS